MTDLTLPPGTQCSSNPSPDIRSPPSTTNLYYTALISTEGLFCGHTIVNGVVCLYFKTNRLPAHPTPVRSAERFGKTNIMNKKNTILFSRCVMTCRKYTMLEARGRSQCVLFCFVVFFHKDYVCTMISKMH